MNEVLESIIDMLHNAPSKRLEFAYIIEQYTEDGIIGFLPLNKLRELEKDIKRTLCKGLN